MAFCVAGLDALFVDLISVISRSARRFVKKLITWSACAYPGHPQGDFPLSRRTRLCHMTVR
jgi:hypothetical protein